MATISTHNGSQVARDHNVRNIKVVSKEEHIDVKKVHEVWLDEKPRDAYARLFGESVKQYNEQQKRTDRQITNYYKMVCEDVKKHPVYEMIIGVYGDENTEQCKEIMQQFVEEWKERNPNLEMIGAYYHADELGEPHVHIDYIPIAHNYTRGMKTQSGLVKAFEEMGFQKQGKITAQMQWQKRENQYLEELCNERGIQVTHPKDTTKHHLETEVYKKTKELETLSKSYKDLDKNLQQVSMQLFSKGKEVSQLSQTLEQQNEQINSFKTKIKALLKLFSNMQYLDQNYKGELNTLLSSNQFPQFVELIKGIDKMDEECQKEYGKTAEQYVCDIVDEFELEI